MPVSLGSSEALDVSDTSSSLSTSDDDSGWSLSAGGSVSSGFAGAEGAVIIVSACDVGRLVGGVSGCVGTGFDFLDPLLPLGRSFVMAVIAAARRGRSVMLYGACGQMIITQEIV